MFNIFINVAVYVVFSILILIFFSLLIPGPKGLVLKTKQ